MSYPKQPSVSKKLYAAALSALDLLIEKRKNVVMRLWGTARRDMQRTIFDAYRSAAPRGRWSLTTLHGSGAWSSIMSGTGRTLAIFQALSTNAMRESFKTIRKQSVLRHAWILDQLTPESRKINIPTMRESSRVGNREATVSVVPPGQEAAWEERWAGWMDAYRPAFLSNIRMGAMNGSSVDDAMDETDATRIGSPASTLDRIINRIMDYESVAAMAAGEDDVVNLNDDLVMQEVWKTRGDKLVCDDCDANEGLTAEESYGDIPLHPNCNCFWEIVPKSYAKLLRSGDEDDRDLARMMQARGLVDISMAIKNDDGDIAAKAIVDFSGWMSGQHFVSGGIQ